MPTIMVMFLCDCLLWGSRSYPTKRGGTEQRKGPAERGLEPPALSGPEKMASLVRFKALIK
jgi:hypothetical protein